MPPPISAPNQSDEQSTHGPYEEFLHAVCLGLYDYLRKSGAQGFVLSLSGGADSSLCAILVAEMIKRATESLGVRAFMNNIGLANPRYENVAGLSKKEQVRVLTHHLLWCVYQESEHSTESTRQAAAALSDELGAHFLHWHIDESVAHYRKKSGRGTQKGTQLGGGQSGPSKHTSAQSGACLVVISQRDPFPAARHGQ